MSGENTPPILKAKLHRPQITDDLVCRERLHQKMEAGLTMPLTLVSAPAGYGKSMLVSHWVESLSIECAWLSLDESDGELLVFLGYLMAAIRSSFPGAAATVNNFVERGELPPLQTVAHTLINDLNEIDEPYVLVLDDYHRIALSEVDELVQILLNHPPRNLHLVLATRRDPSLLLSALRGLGTMNEVRLNDLEFTLPETEKFLETPQGNQISTAVLNGLHEKVEGWPVGLRLVKLALSSADDPERLLDGMSGGFESAQQFLLSEVLNKQEPHIRLALLKSSIFNRFCARLCATVFDVSRVNSDKKISGEEFLKVVNKGGLFSISLDFQGNWFRFHHQFQDLLQSRLKIESSPKEISDLYESASAWFESQGHINEALDLALMMDEKSTAARIVIENSGKMLLTEQNVQIESWLRKLPEEVIEREPLLIVILGYMHHVRFRLAEWAAAINRADALIDAMDLSCEERIKLQGCVDAIRCSYCFFTSDLEGAIQNARSAIESVPPEFLRLRLHSIAVLGISLHLSGKRKSVFPFIEELSSQAEYQIPEAQLMMSGTMCVCNLMDAQFPEMKRSGLRVNLAARETRASVYKLYGRLYQAIAAYYCNELDEVERELGLEISEPHAQHNVMLADWSALLILTHLARNRLEKAQEIANQVSDYGLEVSSPAVIITIQALQAEISIRSGKVESAVSWAEAWETRSLKPQIGFYLPELSVIRVLIAGATEAHLDRAEELLANVEEFARSTHFRPAVISALCLKAILLNLKGLREPALEVLTEALAQAEPGKGTRFFLDLGEPIENLLRELSTEHANDIFFRHLLREFDAEGKRTLNSDQMQETKHLSPPEVTSAINLLTPREQDILELLAQRKRDKEIANELFISPETVKSHLKNIFQKFAVSNRSQAVATGKALKIL